MEYQVSSSISSIHRRPLDQHGPFDGPLDFTKFVMENLKKKQGKNMFSYFKSRGGGESSTTTTHTTPSIDIPILATELEPSANVQRVEVNDTCLERDPGLRISIWKQPVNQRDEIRRAYIKMGPFQPILTEYPWSHCVNQRRRFQQSWFKQFPWIEYSPSKDALFCFPCFLFEKDKPLHPAITFDGFRTWKRVNEGIRCPLLLHVGGPTSPHNNATKSIEALMDVTHHIDKMMDAQSSEEIKKNRARLKATIKSVRWLTLQGCALRGHDESLHSDNRGNFIELISLMGELNVEIDEVVLEKAPGNAKYTSPKIQKEILHILANKVREKIRAEIGDAKFCILIDEAKDVSNKEQMAIILRFVDLHGFLQERFFAIVHVSDTTASTLKKEISDVLTRCGLHICDLRGQGYDGASNMRGAWNGLQALFLRDCPYAYYVHCFAHRLQLALVAAAENEASIWQFFSKLSCIVNLVNASPKRHTELQAAQAIDVARMIGTGERETGRGANQMATLHRAGSTRWSSHFDSICSIIDMYGATINVLECIVDEGSSNSIRGEAGGSLIVMKSFDFMFILRLMHKIMGITNMLCRELQLKSLDILNAMDLVSSTKSLLQILRQDGFNILLEQVESVCSEYDIDIPDMNSSYKGRSRRRQTDQITIKHHYHFDIFNAAIDLQLEELNRRFNEGAMELLILSSALEPKNNFRSFNVDRICRLAEKFYPDDFSSQEMHYLKSQLEHYQVDILNHTKFQNMTAITELCRGLAETNKAQSYNLIDRLIRLVLTLPVSTATTERAFSAMKHVKSVLRSKMNDEFLTDSMVIFVEREIAKTIDSDSIIDEFYSLKNRRVQLQ